MKLTEISKQLSEARDELRGYYNGQEMRINSKKYEELVETAENLLIRLRTLKAPEEFNEKLRKIYCTFCNSETVLADTGIPAIGRYHYCRTCKKEVDKSGNYVAVEVQSHIGTAGSIYWNQGV